MTRRCRNIMLVVSSMAHGGAERVASTLANAWAERGDRVYIVLTYIGNRSVAYSLHERVTVVPLEISSGFLNRVLPPYAKIRALRKLAKRLVPDVVVSFLTNVNVVAIAACAGTRIPLVVSERVDPAARVEVPWWLRTARTLLYQFASGLVVQTSVAATRHKSGIVRAPPIWVIPNPLPQSLFDSELRADTDATSELRVVAMGRLVPQKQFDQLIKACALAFAGRQGWSLSIWGKGECKTSLERLITELELQQRVRLCGTTDRPWSELSRAQVFAMTSAYEGFPNAMLEAMALALPCVVFDCPSGPHDLASENKAAALVPLNDIDALASELRSLADDPARRRLLGRTAAASVRERYSEKSVLMLWDLVFSALDPANRNSVQE